MNVFLVFLILGVMFFVYKKIKSKKPKNLKLYKFKNKLQSTQTNIDRIFLREEEKTFSNPNINICLLYTSDAADEGLGVALGGRRII